VHFFAVITALAGNSWGTKNGILEATLFGGFKLNRPFFVGCRSVITGLDIPNHKFAHGVFDAPPVVPSSN